MGRRHKIGLVTETGLSNLNTPVALRIYPDMEYLYDVSRETYADNVIMDSISVASSPIKWTYATNAAMTVFDD
jgi:hypothetical protein